MIDTDFLNDLDITPYLIPGAGCLDIDRCPDCWEKRAHIERYAFACKGMQGLTVMDFGCGVGYGSEMLARAGNTVAGVEPSPTARMKAISNQPFKGSSIAYWPEAPDADFDATVAYEVIEHLPDPVEFIRTVRTHQLLCSVPVVPTVGINKYHVSDFTMESFQALLETRFDIVYWFPQYRPWANFPSYCVFHGVAR